MDVILLYEKMNKKYYSQFFYLLAVLPALLYFSSCTYDYFEDETNYIVYVPKADENKRIQLALSGMHCTSCAHIIERGLKKVEGVKEAHVNFAAEKATVTCENKKLKIG